MGALEVMLRTSRPKVCFESVADGCPGLRSALPYAVTGAFAARQATKDVRGRLSELRAKQPLAIEGWRSNHLLYRGKQDTA